MFRYYYVRWESQDGKRGGAKVLSLVGVFRIGEASKLIEQTEKCVPIISSWREITEFQAREWFEYIKQVKGRETSRRGLRLITNKH